jgi:hypothetical protein
VKKLIKRLIADHAVDFIDQDFEVHLSVDENNRAIDGHVVIHFDGAQLQKLNRALDELGRADP